MLNSTTNAFKLNTLIFHLMLACFSATAVHGESYLRSGDDAGKLEPTDPVHDRDLQPTTATIYVKNCIFENPFLLGHPISTLNGDDDIKAFPYATKRVKYDDLASLDCLGTECFLHVQIAGLFECDVCEKSYRPSQTIKNGETVVVVGTTNLPSDYNSFKFPSSVSVPSGCIYIPEVQEAYAHLFPPGFFDNL